MPLWIEPAEGDAPVIGRAQPFEYLNDGRLSSAVGAEQAKYFAFFHVETHAANSLDVAILLDEVLDLQDGICHRQRAYSIQQMSARTITRQRDPLADLLGPDALRFCLFRFGLTRGRPQIAFEIE